MDRLFKKLQNKSNGELYNELAPLYDFIYCQHYNYDNQKELIDNISTEDTDIVLEGACGTGQLTKRLIQDYELISVDYSKGMLSMARNNVPNGNYIHADLGNLELDKSVDIYSILGTSILHMTGDGEFEKVASNAYNSLNKEGKFVFDLLKKQDIKNGATGKSTFESDKYTVIRRYLTTKSTENLYRFNFSFEINNNETGESVTTSDSIPVKAFDIKHVENILKNIGFQDISFTSSSEHEYGPEITDLFIAKK